MSMRFPQIPSLSIITCTHLVDALSNAYSTKHGITHFVVEIGTVITILIYIVMIHDTQPARNFRE